MNRSRKERFCHSSSINTYYKTFTISIPRVFGRPFLFFEYPMKRRMTHSYVVSLAYASLVLRTNPTLDGFITRACDINAHQSALLGITHGAPFDTYQLMLCVVDSHPGTAIAMISVLSEIPGQVITLAIYHDNLKVLRYILKHKKVPRAFIKTCLDTACSHGNPLVFKLFVDHLYRGTDTSTNKELSQFTLYASSGNKVHILEYLILKCGVSPRYRNSRALALACMHNSLDSVRVLLTLGAQVSAGGYRAHRIAKANSRQKVLELLELAAAVRTIECVPECLF